MKKAYVIAFLLILTLLLSGCIQGLLKPLDVTNDLSSTRSTSDESDDSSATDSDMLADFSTFARTYLAAIEAKAGAGFIFELTDNYEINVFQDKEQIMTIFLENAYREYMQKGDMDAIIEQHIVASLETLTQSTPDYDENSIMPTIRSADYVQYIVELGANVVYEPFLGEELYIVYVVDFQNSTKALNESDLMELGVERDNLRNLSISNLRRILPEFELIEIEGVYIIIMDDYYESSLLITDFLDEIDIPITGDIVVGIPARNIFAFADSKDQSAIDLLTEFTLDYYEQSGYSITGRLLKYSGGSFDWY